MQTPRGRSLGAMPSQDFYVQHDVPIFTTHELPGEPILDGQGQPTIDPATGLWRVGAPFVVDEQKLRDICANCNARLAGDNFPTVCLEHTPGPNEKFAKKPEVIGLAGPFKMGMHAGKPTIFADFHIFSKDVEKRHKHPRVSVELWAHGPSSRWYIDPIACLGATTPALDLGVKFSRLRSGQMARKYSFVAPSATNAPPILAPGQSKKKNYGGESMADEAGGAAGEGQAIPGAGGGNDGMINDIIKAIFATPLMQWAAKKMAEEGGQDAQPAPAEGAEGENPSPTADPTPEAGAPVEGAPAAEPASEADKFSQPIGSPGSGGATPSAMPAPNPHYEKMCRYMAEGKKGHGEGYMEALGEEDRTKLTDELRKDPAAKTFYSIADVAAPLAAAASMPGSPPTPVGSATPMTTPAKPANYSNQDLAIKYAALEARCESQEKRLGDMANKEKQAIRYSRIESWKSQHGLLIDVAEQVKITEKLDDAAFDAFEQVALKHYAKSPEMVRQPWSPQVESGPAVDELQVQALARRYEADPNMKGKAANWEGWKAIARKSIRGEAI